MTDTVDQSIPLKGGIQHPSAGVGRESDAQIATILRRLVASARHYDDHELRQIIQAAGDEADAVMARQEEKSSRDRGAVVESRQDKLRRLALTLVRQEWRTTASQNNGHVYVSATHDGDVGLLQSEAIADFVAAANPDAVLRLLDELQVARTAASAENLQLIDGIVAIARDAGLVAGDTALTGSQVAKLLFDIGTVVSGAPHNVRAKSGIDDAISIGIDALRRIRDMPAEGEFWVEASDAISDMELLLGRASATPYEGLAPPTTPESLTVLHHPKAFRVWNSRDSLQRILDESEDQARRWGSGTMAEFWSSKAATVREHLAKLDALNVNPNTDMGEN